MLWKVKRQISLQMTFLDENLNELKNLKSKKLANPNSDDFSKSFKSIFGKSFTDDEIKDAFK